MTIKFSELATCGITYLSLLFGTAWLADRGWIPRRLTAHPLVYTLALGVYTSAWGFYGAVGMADQYGLGFLAYYLGISGAFLLAPVLLSPILRITRDYQLASLADLLAFRFRSSAVGALTTLLLLLAMLPMVAMQIQAVAESGHILTRKVPPEILALGFCISIILFTTAFGARRISNREKHHGLVFAVALGSVLKVVVLLTLGGVILFQVFGGPEALQSWLLQNHQALDSLSLHLDESPWRTKLLIFFAAAMVMPDMFHMTFTENQNSRSLNTASWGLPLYLLLISLPVPLILWGGMTLPTTTTPEYYALGVGVALDNPLLTVMTYLGAMSAVSGVIIITTLALSAMVVNHLILPVYQPPAAINIYRWLRWTKRILITAMIMASYGFYRMLEADLHLSTIAIVSFTACLQFLPGVLSTIYWPRANRHGFLSGLIAGAVAWFITMLVPLVLTDNLLTIVGWTIELHQNSWHSSALIPLAINVLVLVVVSIATNRSAEETEVADACSIQMLGRPSRQSLQATSPRDFQERLSRPLGADTARQEVSEALKELNMTVDEHRPYALRRLRHRLEANLSGLMGPSVARDIINRYLPYTRDNAGIADINYVESQVEEYQYRLTGLAAELDNLRRYHRQTLQNLPMAICSLGVDGEILMWNHAMKDITGIGSSTTVGSQLICLPQPWRNLLVDFAKHNQACRDRQQLTIDDRLCTFYLHKAPLNAAGGTVIMVEDQTETFLLEQKLIHSERLASIGQLAAGVAHEIGNPVTGVDCLAQELRSYAQDQESREIAEQILEQTKRIAKILHSLINFAHKGETNHEQPMAAVNLSHCTREAADLLELNKEDRGIQFLNRCDPAAYITGDSQKITQILINLLSNARDASPDGAVVTITTKTSEHTITLEVTDQGCGISKEHQKHLFEPFFTTKEAGKGTGLGMALVHGLVEEHFGTIAVHSPVNTAKESGTRITIKLPRHVAALDNDTKTPQDARAAM